MASWLRIKSSELRAKPRRGFWLPETTIQNRAFVARRAEKPASGEAGANA
jgi:hypothetical protein